MKKKLDSELNQQLVSRAKELASDKKLIEITPLVESLAKSLVLPENFDSRKEYRAYLEKKYK